ncbi:nuclear RNA binding protein [Rutstroemia sp. NJR-2017a BBW]|nr:nuclear RNA binding protein [Rutstroemia sp. NJR-2017a BBW]
MDRSMREGSYDDTWNSLNSRTGSKRSYSNRNSHRPTILGNAFDDPRYAELVDEEYPEGKRHRGTDWPLPPAPLPQVVSPRPMARPTSRGARSRCSTASPPSRRPSLHRSRPSRFVEGSMNDKVSQLPPRTYLFAEEDLRERYDDYNAFNGNGQNRGRKPAKNKSFVFNSNASTVESSVAGGSEISQKSSIFRFGSKIAASMKPSNWKLFSKQPKIPEETPQQKAVRERQEKAERMYHELKSNGFFREGAIIHPSYKPPMDQAPRLKHDSGVELNDQYHSSHNTPTEDKRQGRLRVQTTEIYADSPASRFSQPVDGASTPRKTPFRLKTPSMTALKKEPSRDNVLHSAPSFRAVRRIPSRKEFQKQQKLVKRVSDLESKLDDARRQLSETLGDPYDEEESYLAMKYPPLHHPPPPPRASRSRFIPGALATLPSERLLCGYLDSRLDSDGDEVLPDIGQAITTRESMDNISRAQKQNSNSRQVRAVRSDSVLSSPPRVIQRETFVHVDDDSGSEYSDIEMSDDCTVFTAVSANGARVVDIKSPTRTAPIQSIEKDEMASPVRVVQKKKSALKGAKDGDAKYEPAAESLSGTDSDPDTLAKPVKRVRSSRNRRLINEVTPEPSTPKRVISNPNNGRKSATRTTGVTNRIESTRPKSILVKLKLPKESPLPDASNRNSLDYQKPASMVETNVSSHHQPEELAMDHDHYDEDVPPVPKLPRHVRLASGELLSLQTSKALQSVQTTEPQDWPEDLEIF